MVKVASMIMMIMQLGDGDLPHDEGGVPVMDDDDGDLPHDEGGVPVVDLPGRDPQGSIPLALVLHTR